MLSREFCSVIRIATASSTVLRFMPDAAANHLFPSAHKVGIKCAWINRPKAIMGVQGRGEQPDFEFSSMAAFADEMEKIRR